MLFPDFFCPQMASLYSSLALAEGSTPKTENEAGKIKLTNTIDVTATLSERDLYETPRAVNLVSRQEYERISPTTALDARRDEIGIWAEIKTATTRDPVMQGLSGSFYRYAFSQIARLIDIASAQHGHVVGQQLKRNDHQNGKQVVG
jgi:hypothetical protein